MQIKLHPAQSMVFRDMFIRKECQFSVAVCTRGWGKSYLAAMSAMQAVRELQVAQSKCDHTILNKNVALVAPTHGQALSIYQPILEELLQVKERGAKFDGKQSWYKWPDGTKLYLGSFEAINRYRGTGFYFIVCDEIATWHTESGKIQEACEGSLFPCVTTRWSAEQASKYDLAPGRIMVISTPMGYNYLYDLYTRHELDNRWKSYHFDFTQAPHLSNEEIELAKQTYDPLKFAREYKASFDESGAAVFYNFERLTHVTKDLEGFMEGETIHAAIDFNVGRQSTSFFAVRGDQMHFLDEMMGQPDTTELAKAIKARYPKNPIVAYPDPSGRAKKTSATTGATDFKILESYGIRTRARSKHPPIVDSAQCVNRMLKNANGEVNMYVHPKCKGTIESLQKTVWKEGNSDSAMIDKSLNVEHFSDGIRYATEYLFPINAGKKRVIKTQTYL